MEKNRKFHRLNWKITVSAVILYNLVLCDGRLAAAETGTSGEAAGAGVTVRVKVEDAQRQQELDRLRREASEAKAEAARLQSEKISLAAEHERRRQELIELTQKYQKQNEQYLQLQLVLAGALASGEVRSVGEREEQLFRALKDTAERGRELAVRAAEFCELTGEATRDLPIGKVRQTELKLKQDELQSLTRRFMLSTSAEDTGSTLEKCRILGVDPQLSIVVLSVGRVHGAFNGLLFQVGKDPAQLKVVSVRPFVSLAVLVSGNIDALTPGMEVVNETKHAK